MTVKDLIKTLNAYYPQDAEILIPSLFNPNETASVDTIILDETRNTVELMTD